MSEEFIPKKNIFSKFLVSLIRLLANYRNQTNKGIRGRTHSLDEVSDKIVEECARRRHRQLEGTQGGRRA